MASSKLLINEHPLQVLPSLAVAIGLNESIVLQQVHYWLSTSKHYHEGRKWVYNSYEDWKEQFPFWSIPTIQRTIYSLEKKGLLLSGIFNQLPKDRTKWYTINYPKLAEIEITLPSHQNDEMGYVQSQPSHQNDDTISSNCEDASHQIDMMLPETTPETTTENHGGTKRTPRQTPKANPPKAKKEPDPTMLNSAVVAYRDQYCLTPNPEQRAEICKRVADFAMWGKVLADWRLNSSSPKSIGDMLDRYEREVRNAERFKAQSNNGNRWQQNQYKKPAAVVDLSQDLYGIGV